MTGYGIFGKYFSFSASAIAAGTDLIERASTLSGSGAIVAKKLTFISSASLTVDVNKTGVWSSLYQDSDLKYKLSLDAEDCLVHSLIVSDTTGSPVFLAVIY